ncbi:MAG TPA: glycosyltransferase family 9 protein [Nitriliruptorales bacterium]|nr:glycosyltransferase family 9 protein [Nitriliruptorales bacterium]
MSLLVAYRTLGLGDLLTAVPALRALADAFPGHRRVLATPGVLAPLAALTGAVDDVVDTGELAPVRLEASGFHIVVGHRPDVAVNLHGRGPESHRAVLACRPGRLLAFAHQDVPRTRGSPRWRRGEHEVTRWCRLLEESGIAADPGRLDLPPPDVPAPAEAAGVTVVHPGAKDRARCWPADRWVAVARSERGRGRKVVITGSAAERPLAEAVARDAGLRPHAVLAGRTDLLQLAAVVAVAGRVVCGDTGVAHLATALRTPSVVLFGPVPPAEWGPPPDRPWHVALWAGRGGDPHAAEVDPGLLDIEVTDVLEALRALPGAEPAARRQPPPRATERLAPAGQGSRRTVSDRRTWPSG